MRRNIALSGNGDDVSSANDDSLLAASVDEGVCLENAARCLVEYAKCPENHPSLSDSESEYFSTLAERFFPNKEKGVLLNMAVEALTSAGQLYEGMSTDMRVNLAFCSLEIGKIFASQGSHDESVKWTEMGMNICEEFYGVNWKTYC
jgi:hypothetical protein